MITDSRSVVDFQNFTFSGHSRKLSNKSLLESIQLGHADYACYWSLELLCSGLVHSLWNTFFESASLSIHRACPNIFVYLTSQYERFATIENAYSLHNMTEIRNREDARIIVCEVATALATAKKQKTITLPKIKPDHDNQAHTHQENIRATRQSNALPILNSEDPYELSIPFNEFCFSIQTKDTLRALYWISWILAYAREQKKVTKETLSASIRANPYVSSKYGRNIIWMLWDVINSKTNQYIDALFKLYCLRWEPGNSKARLTYLLTAVLFCTETIDTTEPAKRNEVEIGMMLAKIPSWIETIQTTKNTFSSR